MKKSAKNVFVLSAVGNCFVTLTLRGIELENTSGFQDNWQILYSNRFSSKQFLNKFVNISGSTVRWKKVQTPIRGPTERIDFTHSKMKMHYPVRLSL